MILPHLAERRNGMGFSQQSCSSCVGQLDVEMAPVCPVPHHLGDIGHSEGRALCCHPATHGYTLL